MFLRSGDAIEPFEHFGSLGSGNAGAIVDHLQCGTGLALADTDRHSAALLCVNDGVVNDVGDELVQQYALAAHEYRIAALEAEIDPLASGRRQHLEAHLARKRRQIDVLNLERAPGLAACQGEQLADHPSRRVGGFVQAGHDGAHGVQISLQQGVADLGPQHRQRCLQLMRGIGDEPRLSLAEHALAFGVRVDCMDERCHLARHGASVNGRQVVRAALAHLVAQSLQRGQALPHPQRDQARGAGNQQKLYHCRLRHDAACQLAPGVQRLGHLHEQLALLGVVEQSVLDRHDTDVLVLVDRIVEGRPFARRVHRRRKILVAGDVAAVAQVGHTVEDAVLRIRTQHFQRRIGQVGHHLAVGQIQALADDQCRAQERAIVGFMRLRETAHVADDEAQRPEHQRGQQQPSQQQATQARHRLLLLQARSPTRAACGSRRRCLRAGDAGGARRPPAHRGSAPRRWSAGGRPAGSC